MEAYNSASEFADASFDDRIKLASDIGDVRWKTHNDEDLYRYRLESFKFYLQTPPLRTRSRS